MDNEKIGQLIYQLRKEKGLTQSELAEQIGVTNKAVSKWERGNGAPDVTLWEDLSSVLGADVLKLLKGELNPNSPDTGKIDNIRFHVCPSCGNTLTSTSSASISCCGRRLSRLNAKVGDDEHKVNVEQMDIDYYISIEHEMMKDHYISFVAYVYDDRIWFQRLYPEQNPAFHMPMMRGKGTLYLHCVVHGLYKYGKLF